MGTGRLALVLIAAFLGSCGGGGGGGSAPAPTTFTLSGEIAVPADTLVDGDVNDLLAAFVPNDDAARAQEVANAATIGGYVNQAGTGEPGRSYHSGDPSDFYRAELGAGQVISMLVADPDLGDPDLYLWDETGTNILEVSAGTGALENLAVADAGLYLVEVRAFEGASNYVLAIGQSVADAGGAGLSTQADFVAGEAVVQLAGAKAPQADSAALAGLALRHEAALKAGDPGREVLLSLPAQPPALASTTAGLRAAEEHERRYGAFRRPETAAKWATLQAIKRLRRDNSVAHAEPNYIRRVSVDPNDSYYPLQWHYPQINLPLAWDITTGESAVIVGVVDSGIVLFHPEFQGRLVAGYDFMRDATASDDGDGIDPDPSDPGSSTEISTFHGTHVSGTIAAAGDNGQGVSGVGWNIRVMPLRALNEAGGTTYDIRQAIRYAAGLSNDSGTVPAQPARIINMSFGGGPFSTLDQQTLEEARQQGVIFTGAAGNESADGPSYPAAYSGVLSVSAVTIRRTLASYSNFGATIDLAAPGGDFGDFNGDGYPDGVLSTCADKSSGDIVPNYCFAAGTSMSAPHVAGVLALMRSVNPDLTPDNVEMLLAAGELTEDIGAAGADTQFGYGLIDAQKAVTAASGDLPTPDPAISVTPASLSFGAVSTLLNVAVRGSGAPGVALLSTAVSDAWLVVRPAVVDANDLGQYAVSVRRTELVPGAYSGFVEFVSNANTVQVPVLMEVSDSVRSGNAGLHYVLLLDRESGEVLDQREATAEDGLYSYRFTGVAAGSYQILAGSDADNDQFICDAGEACGAYLTLDQPLEVTVSSANVPGLDFSTGFGVTIHQAAPAGVAAARRKSAQSGLRRPYYRIQQ